MELMRIIESNERTAQRRKEQGTLNVDESDRIARIARVIQRAIEAFTRDYGVKWPKAVAKVVDDAEALLTFFDFPAEHWVHLKTSNPIESTFASVRLRTRVTKGTSS